MADVTLEQVRRLRLSDFVITDLGDLSDLKPEPGPPGPPGKDGVGIEEIVDYFGKVSIIKPINEDNTAVHLSACFYDNPSFDGSVLFTFNTENVNSRQCTYAFIGGLNKGNNTTWSGTAWINMNDNDRTRDGLGPEFDNYPVLLDIRTFIEDNTIVLEKLKTVKHFYAKYSWYWTDQSNEKHHSDNYSFVFPSVSETTSILQQKIGVIQNNSSSSNLAYVNSQDDDEYFVIQPNALNIINVLLTSSNAKILLDNYAPEKTYKVQFTIGSEQFDADQLEVYCKKADGANEPLDELKTNIKNALKKYQPARTDATFSADTKYLIECQLQMVTLITSSTGAEQDEP